jgi:nitric oxide synthase-interacting protein
MTDANGFPCCVVTQKKDIKRQKQRLDALKKEHAEEQDRARAAARERVLQEFEKGQLGLGPSATSTTNGADNNDGEYWISNL